MVSGGGSGTLRLRAPVAGSRSTHGWVDAPSSGAVSADTSSAPICNSPDQGSDLASFGEAPVTAADVALPVAPSPVSSANVFARVSSGAAATLTVSAQPIALLVQGTGTASYAPSNSVYSFGQSVTLTATPGRYYAFSRWLSNSVPIAGAANLVTSISATNSYTAVFTNTVPLEFNPYTGIEQPVGSPMVLVEIWPLKT